MGLCVPCWLQWCDSEVFLSVCLSVCKLTLLLTNIPLTAAALCIVVVVFNGNLWMLCWVWDQQKDNIIKWIFFLWKLSYPPEFSVRILFCETINCFNSEIQNIWWNIAAPQVVFSPSPPCCRVCVFGPQQTRPSRQSRFPLKLAEFSQVLVKIHQTEKLFGWFKVIKTRIKGESSFLPREVVL